MVPYGEFSSKTLLSSPRNYPRRPDEFKRTGPFQWGGGQAYLEIFPKFLTFFYFVMAPLT